MADRFEANWVQAFIPAYTVDRLEVEPHEDVWDCVPTMTDLHGLVIEDPAYRIGVMPTTCGECGGPLDVEFRCNPCMRLVGDSNFQLYHEFVRRIGGAWTNTGYRNTPLEQSSEL